MVDYSLFGKFFEKKVQKCGEKWGILLIFAHCLTRKVKND